MSSGRPGANAVLTAGRERIHPEAGIPGIVIATVGMDRRGEHMSTQSQAVSRHPASIASCPPLVPWFQRDNL